ncbi:MAG TPA: hypothetical protein VKZ49_05535, partial [Polyangiaceae bacterium]|nr:hypothetical protein [Polyangiaceae bacterium]
PPRSAPPPPSAAPPPRSAPPPPSAAAPPPSAAPIADSGGETVPAPPGPDLPLPSFAGVPTRVKFEGRTVLAKLEALPEVQAAAAGELPPAPRPPSTPPTPGFERWLSQSVALLRRGAEQSASGARRAHAAACGKVDALRDRLPGRWRTRLRPISTPVIVAAGFGLCLLTVVVALGLALRPARSVPAAAASAPPPEAAPAELLASAKTPRDLEPLAAKYPRDARIPLKRATLLIEAKQATAAIDALQAALKLAPSLTSDDGAEKVVWQALQGDDAAAQAALGVAREHLGERGPDLIYDLAASETVALPVRNRANEWLKDTALTARGSPAFAIALDLRNAKNCRERYKLLARAEQHGDVRALTYLRPLRLRVGCGRRGRDDCYECLHQDDRLDNAIAAIEARTTAPKPEPRVSK